MSARTAADLAADLAWRCDGVKKTAEGWMVKCPAHDDSTASLSITPGSDKVLANCFARCEKKDILDALGLGWDALFVQPRSTEKYHDSWEDLGPIVALYDYVDASGTLLHQTVRFLRADGKKDMRQRRPDPAKPGRWLRRVKDITQVLYHLPQVIKAIAAGELVILVEGEKDADSLEALGLTATTNPAGVKSWKSHYDEMLRGAHLVCLPDFDPGGQQHMVNVATRLQGIAASIKLLTDIHTAAPKSDVSDWLAEDHTRAELEAAVAACPAWTPLPGARTAIKLNTEMTRIVDEGQKALLALPKAPMIYQRAHMLTVIGRGAKPPRWLRRVPDLPMMLPASAAHLQELAAKAARWEQWDERKEDWKQVLPPWWFVPTLQGRTDWPFPPIEGIISSPTLRPDGSLLAAPGYDLSTGLYLDYNGTTFPALPEKPTVEHARTAIESLREAVINFPFTRPCHFSATLAAMLSMVCRVTIEGCVPFFAVTANTGGSGKGLLVDGISIIGTGHVAPRWPQVKEDEEERKQIFTIALAGYPCIHIDNVTKPLGSSALDSALTADTVSGRLLGKNEDRTVPLRLVWLASGNNMQFLDTLARRIVPIDLDPKMERPEERADFKYAPLLPWVQANRPRLTIAALTIMQAYFEAGKPTKKLPAMGSFEAWSDLIRQAIVWAGEPDPNEGRTNIEAESNPEYELHAQLLAAWEVCYPIPEGKVHGEGKTLSEVLDTIAALKAMDKPPAKPSLPNTPNEWDALQDALGAYDFKYDRKTVNSRPVGDALRKLQRKTIAGRRFFADGKRHQAKCWCVEKV